MSTGRITACSAALVCALVGCEAPSRIDAQGAALIYGADDRRELYELAPIARSARAAAAVVALVDADTLEHPSGLFGTPPLGERLPWCAPPPFADQPTSALCTGVLVDRDLILTAGHCASVRPLDRMRAVFGYHYRGPGQLAEPAIYELSEIVATHRDPAGSARRYDYAWLRLAHDVEPPLQPLRLAAATAQAGQPLTVVATSHGLPLKVDAAATVHDARAAESDYFVADSDTSHGASGAPALTADDAVLGVLARGGRDRASEAPGCYEERVLHTDAEATEQFTYAAAARDGLCKADPGASLCAGASQHACSIASVSVGHDTRLSTAAPLLATWLLIYRRLRRRRWR